jgi:hypothetical protein
MTVQLPPGTPIWLDLGTTDPAAASAFYSALFGWTATTPAQQFGGYQTFLLGEKVVAGLMRTMSPEQPVAWSIWLHAPDAEATLAAAVAAGATKVFGPDAVGDLGKMAGFMDPTGAFVGLWQPGTHEGVEAEGPGAPVWYELATRDYAAAVAFYAKVFDIPVHPTTDTDTMRYSRLGDAPSARAGIWDAARHLPEGAPSHWSVYFFVEDVWERCEKAQRLGASIILPAADTPWGPMATLRDPQGGYFRLMHPRS